MFTTSPAPIVINKSPCVQLFNKSFRFRRRWGNIHRSAGFLDQFLQIFRGNADGILLAGSVNICKDYMVCQGERFGKFRKQRFGAGVGVWLENTPYFAVWIIGGSVECGLDFCWMVGVVVDNGNSANLAFILEAAVCAGKASQTFDDRVCGKPPKVHPARWQPVRWRRCGCRNLQIIAAGFEAVFVNRKGSMSVFVVCDVSGLILRVCSETVCNDAAGQIFGDFFVFWRIRVDDQRAVLGKEFCKTAERAADVVNVLEKSR